MNFRQENGQWITPISEYPYADSSQRTIQDKFRAAGLYVEFDDKREYHIPEIIYEQVFTEQLSSHGWNIDSRFRRVSKPDFVLTHEQAGIVVRIDVKTKPEPPAMYVERYFGTRRTDRSASHPPEDVQNVIDDSDFLVYCRSSETETVLSGLTDSSTETVGIVDNSLVTAADYTVDLNRATGGKFAYLPHPHKGFILSGKHSVYEFCGMLKEWARRGTAPARLKYTNKQR